MIKRTITAIIIAVAVAAMFALPAPARAADDHAPISDDPVIIEAKADKKEVTVGDPITYTVTATYEKEYKVEFPAPGGNLGEFEIRDYSKKGPVRLADGRMETAYEFIIAAYSTGKFEIEPIAVTYWKREDEKQTLSAPKIEIEIKSLLGKEAKDIHDIKPPLTVPFPYLKYGIIAGIALLALAGIVAGIVLLVKKSRARAASGEAPIFARRDPPHVIALREIDELAALDLVSKGLIKEFYIEMSEIIRRYISARHGVVTMERTTYEIMRDLRALNLPRAQLAETGDFLNDADMVKFAKLRPAPDKCRDDLERARRIIETTAEKAA